VAASTLSTKDVSAQSLYAKVSNTIQQALAYIDPSQSSPHVTSITLFWLLHIKEKSTWSCPILMVSTQSQLLAEQNLRSEIGPYIFYHAIVLFLCNNVIGHRLISQKKVNAISSPGSWRIGTISTNIPQERSTTPLTSKLPGPVVTRPISMDVWAYLKIRDQEETTT
jgi:hypothetical protein